jgi:hypothetical protein
VADAVKTPAGVIEPPLADQVTDGLYAPAPVTFDVQFEVCETRIGLGRQVTETEVIAGGTATTIVADPNLVASWTEVAVIVPIPAADGVKIPAGVIVPPVADQITAGLYFPVP